MDPTEYRQLLRLSKIYEDAGRYDEAEQTLLKAHEVKPKRAGDLCRLSGFYNRQGDFDKTIEALNQRRRPPARKPRRATTWSRCSTGKRHSRIKRLTQAQQKEYIAKGIEADGQGA